MRTVALIKQRVRSITPQWEPKSVRSAQLAFERIEMRAHLGIFLAKVLDLANRAHHGRVIPIAKRAPELREGALQALLAQVHRHMTGERDALVAILRDEIG